MSAAEVLNMAQAEGVTLVLEGERLTWRANHQPPCELLAEIKAHRLEIIEALSTADDPSARARSKEEADRWLARVADLLGCEPGYLLERDFIDRHDLDEQYRTHPRFAARLIRTHPAWSAQPAQHR